MVVKGSGNGNVEKQHKVVGTMWNKAQNMCATEDDINARKWKGQ